MLCLPSDQVHCYGISMFFHVLIALALSDEITVSFERESVSKLWLNGTLGCFGTQCNDLGFFIFNFDDRILMKNPLRQRSM